MKQYLGAAIGTCVHVGGIVNFLRLAEEEGHQTQFLGAAVSIEVLLKTIAVTQANVICIGYRLTPETVIPLLDQLQKAIEADQELKALTWVFGGTKPVAEVAMGYDYFQKVFDGTEDLDDTIQYLRGSQLKRGAQRESENLIDRIRGKSPYPLLRHHFGLPSLEDTLQGVKAIAEAKVLDIISVGPDQNTQENYFTPEKMNQAFNGAGGVPLRKKEDFEALYHHAQTGNYPLLRCYSGTQEIFRFASLLQEALHNAWCAVPLCWYNVLDGRGPRPVAQSIAEGQQLMKWHGAHHIPIEVNEAHHWSLRDAHDTIGVAMAFLGAYNAKKMGVGHYIAQYMFNVPPAMHHQMDLAKMLAKIQLIESLEDDTFTVYRQVRAGLASLSADLDIAKGQLASSTYLAMAIRPHIIHVVGFSEADHAARPEEVIESCKIVRGVVRSTLHGMVNMPEHPSVLQRKEELVREALYLLDTLKNLYPESPDPWSDPMVLSDAIQQGIIDAPHLRGNPHARGALETRIIDGKCLAYDPQLRKPLTEAERLDQLLKPSREFETA